MCDTLGPTKKKTAGRKTLLHGLCVYHLVVKSATEKNKDNTNAAFHQHVTIERAPVVLVCIESKERESRERQLLRKRICGHAEKNVRLLFLCKNSNICGRREKYFAAAWPLGFDEN